MDPLGIHHVSINVADAERSVTFYTDVLGGSLREDRPDLGVGGAWIDLGPSQVHLIETDVPPNMGQHFAVLVADLDHTVDELRGKGLECADPVAIGANRQTFIEDPSGNTVELHETGASAPLGVPG